MTKDIFWVVMASFGVMAVWLLIGLAVMSFSLKRKYNLPVWAGFVLVGPIGWVFYHLVDEVIFGSSGDDND